MITIPVIETERLILREPRESDVAHEAVFYASERSKFVGGPMSLEEVWRAYATIVGHWVWRGYGFWAIEDKSTNAYLGHVGLWYPEGWPEREIGWSLTGNAEGKGYAHEAAIRVRKYAYETLAWDTAISLIDPENTRSIALANRLGAKYEYDFSHERHGLMGVYRHPAPEALQ
jgi:RimJ/RimL family protein N-acetyltransferase